MFDRHDLHPRSRRGRNHHPGFGLREMLDPFRGRRPSVRRGDVRLALLALLQEGPMHGYQMIQELEAKSAGRWRPSAGSVYPTLQQLEDEGLVRSQELDGRRTYSLTDEGRAFVAANPTGGTPWIDGDAGAEAVDLRRLTMQLMAAAIQVHRIGSPRTVGDAREILVDARRRMYRLLAEDEADTTE